MRRKRKKSQTRNCLLITVAIIVFATLGFGAWTYNAANTTYDLPKSCTIVIPPGATDAQIGDSLKINLGQFGETVYRLWALRNGNPEKAAGVYIVAHNDKAWTVAGRIKNGRSSVVKVTFNNVRLLSDLAKQVARYFPWTAQDFLDACQTELSAVGFSTPQFPAAFFPDTYEFYASASPRDVIHRLLDYRNSFWNDERLALASNLGLTPIELATLASIVEEESNNRAEQPTIARLYMNRLKKHMKLQADPTVKFSLGDFSLRRINSAHLKADSPYNTYQNSGLPPGPIRIPDRRTIDLVLHAPDNDFIYMCAKPDNSGTHNFATNYEQHKQNARTYQKWLDSRNIK